MNGHVLLNLLKGLAKRERMLNFYCFHNKLNKFSDTGA